MQGHKIPALPGGEHSPPYAYNDLCASYDASGTATRYIRALRLTGARTYVIDQSESDQGVTATGSGETIYDIAQTVGTSTSAIIKIVNDGNDVTFDTSLDLTTYPYLYIDIEPGAQFDRTTGDETLTVYSPENIIASPSQQITAVDMLAFAAGGVVHPGWWGARADGSTDDTNAISYAVGTGLPVKFSVGRYRVTSTITVSTLGQTLFANDYSSLDKSDLSGNDHGAIIEFDIGDSDPADEIFLVSINQVTFKNLKFVGDSVNTNDRALLFEKASDTDDMDCDVLNCTFDGFDVAIYAYGRGMKIDSCLFVDHPTACITFDWPTSGEVSGGYPDIQLDDLYKGRSILVTNNRSHGCPYFVKVLNYVQRSPIYANNTLDIGRGLISIETDNDTGGIDGGVIDGNICDFSQYPPIYFGPDTYCKNVNITGNVFSGSDTATVDGNDKRPYTFIDLDAPDIISCLTIVGNTFKYSDASAIAIRDISASGAPTTIEGINISGNTFNNIGLDGTADRYIFWSIWDMTGLRFSDNIVINEGATVTRLLQGSSITITDIVVRDNIYDRSSLSMLISITPAGIRKLDGRSGSASIANGTTSIAITHNLSYTPNAEDITVIGKENPTNSVGTIWVDTIGATQFTVNVENDPGASGWDFGWRVDTE